MDKQTLRNDARVIGLVGLAHGVSHFYHLILAALFPWLKTAFALSYSQLALLMTVFFVVSGIGQALAGFVVDRVGARRVLFSGMAMLGVSALVLSNAQSYAGLLAGALLAGMGNSIFHPADYTILNQRVSRERVAHGFSVHGLSGSLGWAAAPLFMTGIAAASDWRTALLSAAALPTLVLVVLWLNRAALRPDPIVRHAEGAAQEGSFDFLRLPSVWMCFGFFFLTALALGGIQSFSTTGLVKLYGMSLALATSAFTAYMLASALGMLLGGFLASGRKEHDRTIGAAFALAAVLALMLGLALVPAWGAVVMMALVGFFSGIAGPSRDLMIRAAAPKNATGRVYGVVYSGLDSGLAVGPLMFGLMMDAGRPSLVFATIAVFLLLAIATATGVGTRTRKTGAKTGARSVIRTQDS
ncbi:MFS transporter [Pseudoduganella sp. DS3]|uniref:MFS transporter n=1 Tax=Pseudoduganella guangdongensis TaxID=2692179 RepID=A0A6N9HHV8_9BURK|nr:MFS transporter [Pseudoduganella guangdongensis]MYN03154.1 MFS transporter [Pseudoduganella guangdongensis]